MAGIGFSISKSLAKGTIRDTLFAYGFAALMGSGPWAISILALAFLGLTTGSYGEDSDFEVFFVSITYAFSFSLVSTGALQLLLSRCASDELYEGDRERVGGLFTGGMLLSMVVSLIAGLALFGFNYPGSFFSQVSAIALFPILGAIWTAISFISAQKAYLTITMAFAIGYGLSFVLAWGLFEFFGTAFMMPGFVTGQVFLLLLLVAIFHGEFGMNKRVDFSFLRKGRTYLPLVLCGFAYNLGIWADKFLYWYCSPFKMHFGGTLFACPVYDVAVYLSFLSIIPGMAVFLLKIETAFALEMSEFVEAVETKATLSMLETRAKRIQDSVRDGFFTMVKVQGLVTVVLVITTESIVTRLGVGALQAGIFQVTLMGAFLCVMFFSLLTVLFYLDCIKEAAICAGVLLVANIVLTFVNLQLGTHTYGTGFVLAIALAIIPAYAYVNRALSQLLYSTFTRVPLGI